MTRFVYADNAATTQISPEVLEAMMPWLTDGYGNASSIYKKGREARIAMEDARHKVELSLIHIYSAQMPSCPYRGGPQ